jgi:cytochrome c peroxidase
MPGRFGNRKPPSAAYGGNSPILYMDADGTWIGGMFWDGRATGLRLGDPLAEQAQGPFLNPVEHNVASVTTIMQIIKDSDYASLFEAVFGTGSLDAADAYDNVGRAIAAYERSAEVSQFTSKYDYWLSGKAKLTAK